jgi:acyl carrier protein
MARIWSEVLEIDRIGATDSFFDLGGDSLRATQVVNRLTDRHGHSIPVTSVFEHVTIRALADALEAKQPLRAGTDDK